MQSTFDSHYKLTLTVEKKKVLPAGNYIIMIAPQWNKSTYLDPLYFNIRVGIYSPAQISLRKCDKETGFKAIAACFEEVSNDTPLSTCTVLQDLPEVYKNHCYRHINQQPIDGLFGYLVFKNLSKVPLEQRLQVSLDQADVVWPEKAKSFNEFNLKIEPGEVELIVFRKKDTLER